MGEVKVLQPGLFSSIQDYGRFGNMKFRNCERFEIIAGGHGQSWQKKTLANGSGEIPDSCWGTMADLVEKFKAREP